MSTYKRMRLPTWVRYAEDEMGGWPTRGYAECAVVFGVEGWYYCRSTNTSWFEWEPVSGGGWKAYQEDNPKQFLYELGVACHRPLTDDEVKAVKTVLRLGRDSRLRELLRMDTDWKQLRYTHHSSMRSWMGTVTRLDAFKLKVKGDGYNA
jgi:hypothetical protein